MLLPMPDDNFMYLPDDDNDVPIFTGDCDGVVIGMWIGFIVVCIALVIWVIVSTL